MINIDTRLLSAVDSDELVLLIHIGKRMNKDRSCFPSIKLLAADTGWGIDKVQKIKNILEQKEIIQIKKGGGRFSNRYTVLTPYLGIYLGGQNTPSGKDRMQHTVKTDSSTIEITTATVGENSNEVLVIQDVIHSSIDNSSIENKNSFSFSEDALNEALKQKELLDQELRDKKIPFFIKGELFETLITCFYPDYSQIEAFHLIKYQFAGDLFSKLVDDESENRYAPLDTLTKNLFNKSWSAAEKIYETLKTLDRGKMRFVNYGYSHKEHGAGPRIYREKETSNYLKEGKRQVEAYVDFCRISGRHQVTDPDKIAETIMRSDWCEQLLDYTKPLIEKETYDPALDQNLISYWLMEMYYWPGDWQVRTCRRYNNRIIDGNEEYLKNNSQDKYDENGKITNERKKTTSSY
jgi:hypothetical protein